MEIIDLAAERNMVPLIRFQAGNKVIILPVTGRRLLMYKAALMHAMGIKRPGDLKALDPENIQFDELESIRAIDDILTDCPETKELAGQISLASYAAINDQMQRLLVVSSEEIAAESDSKKK